MTNQAEFTTTTSDGVIVVAIKGEVDIANVDELRLCLEQATRERGPGIVVDLTAASYFDSRTIALLADFATRMRVHRQRVAVVAPNDGFAARILQIAGLPLIVPAYPSLAEALDAVRQVAGA
ncbi:MAG: STAS domain-containing protein [Candidatus Eremiobacteraeota bacterium]|nr:STAS domain-containing protein [Candidatus Eremiobacteraeota bacterium]